MGTTINTNRILVGTFGRVWVNGQMMANIKSVECKLTMEYEDVDLSGDPVTHRRLMGCAIEGTMTLHKYNSFFPKLMKDAAKSLVHPDVNIVTKMEDKSTGKAERMELYGVTFDEVTLAQWENKTISEEEIPFRAEGYTPLEEID